MSERRLYVGGLEFGIAKEHAEEVAAQVKGAIRKGAYVEVEVLDEHGRQVTLCLNGKQVGVAAIDLGLGAKPMDPS